MSKNGQDVKNKKPIYKQWWFWLVIIAVLAIIGSTSNKDSNNTAQTDNNDTTNQPPKVIEPEPEFEPLMLSGTGINVTKSFEIYKGKYNVKYEFSNNMSSFGTNSGTNFISDIKCDNSSIGIFSLTNLIDKTGSGTKVLDVSSKDTCYFEVETASSKANWTFTIEKR
jgi:hypothetical protein